LTGVSSPEQSFPPDSKTKLAFPDDLVVVGAAAFLHLVAPKLVYPFGQSPHLALPLEFMHLRALSQPPLFVKHGLAGFFGVVFAPVFPPAAFRQIGRALEFPLPVLPLLKYNLVFKKKQPLGYMV